MLKKIKMITIQYISAAVVT